MFFSILLCSVITSAQLSFQLEPSGSTIHIDGLNPTICAPSSAKIGVSPLFPPVDPIQWLSTNESTYHTAVAGFTDTIILDIPDIGPLRDLNLQKSYRYGPADGTLTTVTVQPEPESLSPAGMIRFKMPVTFELGTKKGLIYFGILDNMGFIIPISNLVVIPIAVEGPMEHEVEIIDYTTEPMVPYLVLHDPPGDLSTSAFSESKTICRNFENSYTVDESNDVHAAVKIGVAGSIGFIATIDFSFSVEFSGGMTSGDLVVSTSATGNCITTNQGFATSGLDPEGEEGSDVFIGYGYDMYYGKYRNIEVIPDSCKTGVRERLIYSIKGSGQGAFRKFVLTEGGIRSNIAAQQAIIQSGNATRRDSANALYQIRAWERVLASNDSIIANATEVIGQPLLFNGGAGSDWSESITVMETSTLLTEHYLSGNIGLETVLEIGGSGGSFGYNYTNEKRYGASVSESAEETKVVSYHMDDDDGGDYFKVDVFRDGRYGTPLFRVTDESKSSCPYEGGIPRDKPKIKIHGQEENFILVENVPIGGVAVIKVDLCNESGEDREYLVRRVGSNPGGAIVSIGGETPFHIPLAKNTCEENYELTVQQGVGGATSYSNLKIDMYDACTGEISSSIFVSVNFGTTAVNEEKSSVKQLSIFPNPAEDVLNVNFNLQNSTALHIDLYDMLGHLQMQSIEENFPAGPHQKQLDLTQMSSGIYMLQIQSGSTRITRKLVINR